MAGEGSGKRLATKRGHQGYRDEANPTPANMAMANTRLASGTPWDLASSMTKSVMDKG